MTKQTLELSDALREYMLSVSLREHAVLSRLREVTVGHPLERYQISPEQGQFMALLVTMIGAKRAIEIGVFTGYSSLACALAMPEDGRLVACDINETYTDVARRYWHEAGVAHKIDLRIGPALDTLDRMIAGGDQGTYDFAFIDADKESYLAYFNACMGLIRPGGLIAVDNVLWSGRVIDHGVTDPDTVAIREFNEAVHRDSRVAVSMVPVGDGLTLAVKL